MKKGKILRFVFFGFLALLILGAIGLFYLNKVLIPGKVKALIIETIETSTHKKASLDSVRFNPFKGLILTNLAIYDGQKELVYIQEAACAILILPIFKEKKVFIPRITIKAPRIFVERKPPNIINLMELFPTQQPAQKKQKFSVIVSGIHIAGGHIDFQDSTFSPAFAKSIDNLTLDIFLSLPTSIKFTTRFTLLTAQPAAIAAEGEFQLLNKELISKITLDNILLKEFLPYYSTLGITLKDGIVNASCNLALKLKDTTISANVNASAKDVSFSKDSVSVKLDTQIAAQGIYRLSDKQFNYAGTADITHGQIQGIETIGTIQNLSAKVAFNPQKLTADSVSAVIWDLPFNAKINLDDFSHPILSLEAHSQLNLTRAQEILKDTLKVQLPVTITAGKGNLVLSLKTPLPVQATPEIQGTLAIETATLTADSINTPFKDIQGNLLFTLNELKWAPLRFTYLDKTYQTTGSLNNFNAPSLALNLSSDELSLTTQALLRGKLITITKADGTYFDSKFSVTGDINASDTLAIRADIHSSLEVNLKNLALPLAKYKAQLEKINPTGLVKAKVNLNGNINNLKFCSLNASLAGESLSFYGLNAQAVTLEYTQAEGLADIALPPFAFYDGTVEALCRLNFDSATMPFWLEAKIIDINMEKLKNDTPAKDKDLAGTLQAIAKLSGFAQDYTKLSGAGKILVKDGKLWELNLFKGLGKVIFPKDFATLVFDKGYCEFFIKDQYIFTENLRFESPLVGIEGKGKIGFDNSVEASLNVHLSDDFIPSTGTFKDFTTALMGQAGRFGIIEIRGTLQKPDFKYKTPRLELFKDITGSILDGIFGNGN